MDMHATMTSEVTCRGCGTVLHLRYALVRHRPLHAAPLGCPECQSTIDLEAAVGRLEDAAAPLVVEAIALEKRMEIGVGAEAEPEVAVPPAPGLHPVE